jgi:hypothetical protein
MKDEKSGAAAGQLTGIKGGESSIQPLNELRKRLIDNLVLNQHEKSQPSTQKPPRQEKKR